MTSRDPQTFLDLACSGTQSFKRLTLPGLPLHLFEIQQLMSS